jgi:hypothetical protein
MEEYAHKELSHDIIGAAMKVLNAPSALICVHLRLNYV